MPVPVSVAPMKTIVDMSDPLLREAKRLAAREDAAIEALIERGLHHVIAESVDAWVAAPSVTPLAELTYRDFSLFPGVTVANPLIER